MTQRTNPTATVIGGIGVAIAAALLLLHGPDPWVESTWALIGETAPVSLESRSGALSAPDPQAPLPQRPSPGATPFLELDYNYSSTADLLSPAHSTSSDGPWSFANGETNGVSFITLVDDGPPGAPVARSMQYEWPNRDPASGWRGAPICRDFTINRRVKWPRRVVREMWSEEWVKFNRAYSLNRVSKSFDCRSGGGYKFLLVGVDRGSRFTLMLEPSSGGRTRGFLGWPPGRNEQQPHATFAASMYDDTWHRVRMHLRVNSPGNDIASVEITTADGELVYSKRNTRLTTTKTLLTSYILGANRNQGPSVSGMTLRHGWLRLYDAEPGWGW
ncbi:MAG: hypothetical protein ACKVZ0_13320 [Gemmatimonadales bacterium]